MKRFLAIALIASSLVFIDSPATNAAPVSGGVGISTNGLKMYWDAANPNSFISYATSVNSWSDLSGNSRTATLQNSPTFQHATNGSAFSFNGTNQYATVPTFNDTFSAGFSISFYASFGSVANSWERILDFGTGDANNNILIGRESTYGNIFYESWNGTSSRGTCKGPTSGTGSITTSFQQFTLVVSSSGVCQYYLNGSTITTTQTASSDVRPIDVSRASNYIARSNWAADSYFEGSIVRVAVYNRALNSTEVTQNYNSMTDMSVPTVTNGWVNLNENETTAPVFVANEASTFQLLTGLDGALATISSSGAITFTSAPNYEVPLDTGADNTYAFNVRVIDNNGNYWDYLLAVWVINVAEFATLSTPSLSGSPNKGSAITITVTPSAGGTAGTISYLMAGKRIVGCYKKSYSGSGNSTCSWKPMTMGYREITVTFTPSGTEYGPATIKKSFFVGRRTNTR
jgi:hypothetical protein